MPSTYKRIKHGIAQVSKDMGPGGTALVTIMPLVDKRLILLRHVDTHTSSTKEPREWKKRRNRLKFIFVKKFVLKMTNYVMDMTVWAVFTSWMLQHAAQGKGVRLREIFTGIDIEMSKEENYVIYRKE